MIWAASMRCRPGGLNRLTRSETTDNLCPVSNILKSLSIAALLLLGTLSEANAAVVVSSKLSSESVMIGQMIRLLLEAHGIKTVDRTALGATPVVRKALIAGEIDIYIEYTGNAGFFFNRAADPVWKDLRKGYELGARLDYQANHIVWLTPANASNAWALAVRSDVARANGLHTMSDFARWVSGGGRVVLACSAEFANAGTLRSLEKTYGFKMRLGADDRAGRRRNFRDHRSRGGAHQRHQHRDGVRHGRRHRRGESRRHGG